MEPTETELRLMTALALEVSIQASFRMHTYTFGGKVYQQSAGGPIGARLTMAVARIVMEIWRRMVREKLEDAGIRVHLEGGYVDDMRHLLSLLERGWRWEEKEEKFKYDEKWEKEDADKSRKEVTAEQVLRI